jgi:tetratricopeptide (TPR) repeat protein
LNNKKDAIKEFDEALNYNNNSDAHNYKAHCLMILGDYKEAIESYVKSMNLNEKKYSIINDGNFSIGYCYYKMQKYEEAVKYFDISKKVNEKEIKNLYLKGIESCNEGKAEESLIKFNNKYKDLSVKFIDINFYNGLCYMELEKYSEAIKYFDNCNKYDKKFSESYYKKGIIFSMQNKSNEAIQEFEKAILYNNTIPEYKEALQNEKEKTEKINNKNDKNNGNNNCEENKKNKKEEINKITNDNNVKKRSNHVRIKSIIEYENDDDNNDKGKDNDSTEYIKNSKEKKEVDLIDDQLDIKRSKTSKINNQNDIVKNKLISKSRNLNDKNEEMKEHYSTDENTEIKVLLDNDTDKINENIQKTNNTFGPIRYESKTFVIKEK